MAEPPATPLEQAGTGGPDGLLATKLHLPRPPLGLVARPRLLERLEEGLARGLLLVRAGRVRQDQPAGRLGPAEPAAGRLAVAGPRRQRPGAVLAARGRRAGPGAARDRRDARPAA